MKAEERIFINTYIQRETSLPLYSEVFELNSDYDEPFHSHEFFEIGITLDGSASHQTAHGQEHISRGSVYMIPIGESHTITIHDFWHVQNIYLLPRLIFQSLNNSYPNPTLNQFFSQLINKDFQSIVHFILSEAAIKDIESLAETYNKISLSDNYLLDNYRSNCLFNMMMLLCDAYYKKNPDETINKDVRIYKIMDLIHENINASTGDVINEISEQLSLHPQHINRIIKKAFSTTLSNLILETKIEKSCELLINSYSITEAAQALAFYDHSHYNKYFIKYFGISPSQYRNKYNNREAGGPNKQI